MKETAAQRKNRFAEEKAIQDQHLKNSHLPRIMAVLTKAQKLGWAIEILAEGFLVQEQNIDDYFLSPFFESEKNDLLLLEYVESRINQIEAENAERDRLYSLKKEVLSRLSDDELKSLGYRR
jgi:hypothetical protein